MNLMEFIMTGLMGALVSSLRFYLVAKMEDVPFQYKSGKAPLNAYDFIVVGSGCGGSAVAGRLSETGATVLLLEAGGPAPPESAVPDLSIFTNLVPHDDWKYDFVPQKHAMFGYKNNTIKIPYSKMMGGLSSKEGMVFLRGNRRDFDLWAQLGNKGWDYKSVLPYFKKLETFTDVSLPVDADYHGFKGPVGLTRKRIGPALNAFLKAGIELGYSVVDANGPEQIGFSPSLFAIKDGVRASASESYVTPVKDRQNLEVRTHATVQKVLFDANKRVIGVQYYAEGKVQTVRARKEVILSAGSFETPKLLMLSGIGPRAHLEKMGIPVVAAVEGVGRNYHDHPAVYIPLAIREGTGNNYMQILTNLPFLKDYVRTREGFFANPLAADGFAWFNLSGEVHPLWTDVLMDLSTTTFAAIGGRMAATGSLNYKEETYDDIYGSIQGQDAMSIFVMLCRPKSRGRVTLRSINPDDYPLIDLNTFSNKDDLQLLRKGIRMTFRVANTDSFRKDLQARYTTKLLTPCRHLGRDTDAYWECYAQHTVVAGFHSAGTAKMAPESDPMGVVSPRLRVRGVFGLRVADASIMPAPVAANTMAPTYMIGEKAADMIKEDWGYPTEPLVWHTGNRVELWHKHSAQSKSREGWDQNRLGIPKKTTDVM